MVHYGIFQMMWLVLFFIQFCLIYFPNKILRPAPRFCPACVAPLFEPACKPIIDSPALNCSSLKSRLHSSDGFGPRCGPLYSGCL